VTEFSLWRRLLAEVLGSTFLAAAVIGSGIAAQRLSPGDTGPGRAGQNMKGHLMANIPEVLFVCTHNAGRSQMAAALLRCWISRRPGGSG
jgi:hypothetical protein